MQRRIQNTTQRLKWNFIRQELTGFHPLTILTESSILNIWLGSEYAYAIKTSQHNLYNILASFLGRLSKSNLVTKSFW